MSELRVHKHELFARFVADDHSQSESYELAGYRPSTANASTLANRPDVKERVRELREEKLERKAQLSARLAQLGVEESGQEEFANAVEKAVIWTVAKVQQELFQNARLAQAAGEFGAATKCFELIGKSVNMWEEAKGKNDGSSKPQVSISIVSDAISKLTGSSGEEPANSLSPLAPRVSSPCDAKR